MRPRTRVFDEQEARICPPAGHRPDRGPAVRRVPRVFLLSPASLAGVRGRRILEGEAGAGFMERLGHGGGAPLGEIYAFISSLYYRGKRTYAHRFGRPSGESRSAVFTITSSRGLLPDETPVALDDLRTFASTEIGPANPDYLGPLTSTARALERDLGPGDEVVLLGSIASGKYLDPLAEVFGRRLLIPHAFIGRGDMSRGGLLLRAAAAGEELDYVVALEAERRGPRPPRLE